MAVVRTAGAPVGDMTALAVAGMLVELVGQRIVKLVVAAAR